jgi:hypothetical protein
MSSYATGAQPAPYHVVTLNYTNEQFTPDPVVLIAEVGDAIEFRKGAGGPEGTLRVAFDHPEYFSVAEYAEGDAPVVIESAPPRGSGTYSCLVESDMVGSDGSPALNRADGGSVEVGTSEGT